MIELAEGLQRGNVSYPGSDSNEILVKAEKQIKQLPMCAAHHSNK